MRAIISALALFLLPMILTAQQTPEWSRVYTFEESVIEINTAQVTLIFENRGRVKFRWSFDKPEALSAGSRIKYKSRLEVIEFDCLDKRYRPYQVTLFDDAGKAIRFEEMNPPGAWRAVASSDMMGKLYAPACELIKPKLDISQAASSENAAAEKAERFARLFSQRLEKTKDFAPLVKEFFAPDYLGGYLRDKDTNWLLVLDPDVATKVSRADLQRYYVALLNIGYLGGLYFVSQPPSPSDESVSDEKIIPPGIVSLIKNHPYTATYKGMKSSYDYLADKIDSPERLRRYTDLLEKVAALFRRNVIKASAEKPVEYRAALDDLAGDFSHPQMRICAGECFGLPKGTKLFQVGVPVFNLQIAEINGEMKIVSATPNFQ